MSGEVFRISSQCSQSDIMDGNNKSAPASSSTLSGNGPVLTAMVKMRRQLRLVHPRGRFPPQGFPRLYTGFFQPHEIRFRVGLAVFYIKAGHHQFSPENVWEIMVQPVDKADLSGTGDDHRSETAGFYLFQ